MQYQKPEIVGTGSAIRAIQAEFNKGNDQPDSNQGQTTDAYESDE